MTVLSEDSDETAARHSLSHPRKKARLSRHASNNPLDNYQVVTSAPVYLNNYMETDPYSGGINGRNFPESPGSCNQPHPDDISDALSPTATLSNLGNTCFLNSVLYTLRFAPSFLHNLHHLVNDINVVTSHSKHLKGKSSSLSRLGSTVSNKMWSREPSFIPEAKMECTSKLHDVYEDLRRNEICNTPLPDPVHPTKFMQSLRAVNSMFEGNQQHDAHELYIFLLDNLRETSKDVFKFATQFNLTSTCSSSSSSTSCGGVSSTTTPLSNYGSISSPSSPSPSSSSSTSLLMTLATTCSSSSSSGLGSSSVASGTGTTTTSSSSSSTKKMQDKLKKTIKRFRTNSNCGGDSKKGGGGGVGSVTSAGANASGTGASGATLTASTNSLNDRMFNGGDMFGGGGGMNNDSVASSCGGGLDLNNLTEDFQGVSIIRTICSECEHVKERKEAFCDICVPIISDKFSEHSSDKYGPGSSSDADKIDGMTKEDKINELYRNSIVTEEMLIESNKYWCEECLRYNEAKRCYRFEVLPRLLTLHLKRFSSGFNSGVSKVSNFMPTPFKLKCFCEHCLNSKDGPYHIYDLYAVIMHLGSTIASGHYVSYVKARDNTIDYVNCPKDKRKTTGLISNEMERSKCSILKFLRPNKSNDPPAELKYNHSSQSSGGGGGASSTPRLCRTSLDCCGARISGGNIDKHHLLSYQENNNMGGDTTAWLECDDENVRTLTKHQFQEMLVKLSPAQGTPYLLFYTRVNLTKST